MLQQVIAVVAVVYLFDPAWCCLINNCPSGGKRSDAAMELEGGGGVSHRHQKRARHWNDRIGVPCKLVRFENTEEGVCVGPLCCDSSGPPSIPALRCSIDYETCGSSRSLMEEYALCLSPGLVCDKTTRRCCNFYDHRCFDSIMCQEKDVLSDYYRDRDPPPVNLSVYENLPEI